MKTSKTCTKCRQDKPLERFGNRKANPDGKEYTCKDCLAAYVKERRKHAVKCNEGDCDRLGYRAGWCHSHYARYLKYGEPGGTIRGMGKRGDGWINYGYKYYYMPKHPNADKAGKLMEHRYVMSEHLGRPLLPNENVHHKNGNKLDNRLENLELWVKSQPAGQRPEDLVAWATEILELYGPMSEASATV